MSDFELEQSAAAMTESFRDFLENAPLEDVQRSVGLPLEFWHSPEGRRSHWTFGVVATVSRDEAGTHVGMLLPPSYGEQESTADVPPSFTRWSVSGLHPTMERHLAATRRALTAARVSRRAYDLAVAEVNAAANDWSAAFEEGLAGERPEGALVRAADIGALAYYGISAGPRVGDEERGAA